MTNIRTASASTGSLIPLVRILERESGKVSGDLIQVLVCDEIYKRRHGGKRGMIAFL